jgi:acetolactate synthase-1/2/3 large subunit
MDAKVTDDSLSCAAVVARFLKARGVDRLFGLQGGHIQPIWDHAARQGIRIIDVRDEGAAVHMAHAHAELTGGVGVAMVTAGPGVTNTVTAIANASIARAPVLLIGGCPPRPQMNMGPLQDIPHVDILRPVTRAARTARVADQVPRELDEMIARAQGDAGEPGPVYIEIPTDVLRETLSPAMLLDEHFCIKPVRTLAPDPAMVRAACDALWSARRPLVVTGRATPGRRWCACSTGSAPRIWIRRKAVGWCRTSIRAWWVPYAAGQCRRPISCWWSAASWTTSLPTVRPRCSATRDSCASPTTPAN